MKYQHKVINNSPFKTVYKFESDTPYIPHKGEVIVFPDGWKAGCWFVITKVDHYLVDKLIIIRVKELKKDD